MKPLIVVLAALSICSTVCLSFYVVGEGIEKKVDNFADEVAAQVAAAKGQ